MDYSEFFKHTSEEKIELHQAFLERTNINRPLIGLIQGWENLSRYVPDTEAFFPKGEVNSRDLSPDRFLQMYRDYVQILTDSDEIFATVTPLPFFPWAEAAMGCPIQYTGKNFWAKPIEKTKTPGGRDIWIQSLSRKSSSALESQKKWLNLYIEFLDFLTGHFAGKIPVGQGILRGPLDIAAAVLGEENMIYLFFDHPEFITQLLSLSTSLYLDFMKIHDKHIPLFFNGCVVGQYGIWTPGSNLRHQEDAMALLSPDLYREFVHPHDCTITSHTSYCLFHLHSSGMHLLDILLENEGIHIYQVSKDEGVNLETILFDLKKIQNAGRCMIIKGRFQKEEVKVLKKEFDPRGLCIQAVVLKPEEKDEFLSVFL